MTNPTPDARPMVQSDAERARVVLACTMHSDDCVGNMSNWDRGAYTHHELLEMGECDCDREIRAMLAFATPTRLPDREAIETAVHQTMVRWADGDQPMPIRAMVADAIIALSAGVEAEG